MSTLDSQAPPRPAPSTNPPSLLTVRAAVVLLFAVLVGVGAGLLTFLAGQPLPTAVLAGGGAVGAAASLLNSIIG